MLHKLRYVDFFAVGFALMFAGIPALLMLL